MFPISFATVMGGTGSKFYSQGLGMVPLAPGVRTVFGGALGGLHYAPDLGDLLVVAKASGSVDVPLGFHLDPATAATLAAMAPGEVLLLHKSGSSVRLAQDGDIVLTPAPGRAVVLAGGTAGVARQGDTVSVSGSVGSGGGAFTATGTITAGAAAVKA